MIFRRLTNKRLQCYKKRNSPRSLRNIWIPHIIVLTLIFTVLLAMNGCKRRPEDEEKPPVSLNDIKIGYPDIEGQKKQMQKFSHLIEQESHLDNPDEVLRQIIADAPLVYIETHLQELAQKPSTKNKPNISILLDRIKKIRNLDERGASEFVQKGKANRNTNGLSVALFALRTEPEQAKAAEALGSLGDPKAVRVLTIRLLGAAGMPRGGAEASIYRENLRRSLVRALENCTGLDFSDYDATEAATLEVVKRCEDWLAKTGK